MENTWSLERWGLTHTHTHSGGTPGSTGEAVCVCVCVFQSGHMPCVRVWELGGGQVAEAQTHKYGVSCVAFSTNSCYIVSVGYQHDMTVSVWDWRVSATWHRALCGVAASN